MADADDITAFFEDFSLGPDATVDGKARVWYSAVEGTRIVFTVADGENVDGEDLAVIAERGLDALREEFAECADFTYELREKE
jgi:hypothetical protein